MAHCIGRLKALYSPIPMTLLRSAAAAQIFEAVLAKELGPARPPQPLPQAQRERVQRLVTQNAGHLHDDDANLAAKIEEKTRDPRVPGVVRTLLWIFTPPGPRDPIGQACARA